MKKEMITIKNGDGKEVEAYVSHAGAAKSPAIIVVHEIWGLNDQTKGVADRLAGEGYLALAPDLMKGVLNDVIDPSLLKAMMDPVTRNEAQKKMREATAPVNTPEFAAQTLEKLKGCFEFLKNYEGGNGTVGIIGFCFGGTYAFALAGAEPELKFAIPFYGHPPAEDVIKKINCPVLALYGETDERLMATLPELVASMKKHKKNFRYVVYKGVGHAFFNETNTLMYNADAAEAAWQQVKGFLDDAQAFKL